MVEGGGDCVTFKEVNRLNEAAGDGQRRARTKLSGDVADYLAEAEAAHDEGRHAAAVDILTQAKGKAHGLQDDVLVAKIADLIEWQSGLVGF